jgi:hypothetical protein
MAMLNNQRVSSALFMFPSSQWGKSWRDWDDGNVEPVDTLKGCSCWRYLGDLGRIYCIYLNKLNISKSSKYWGLDTSGSQSHELTGRTKFISATWLFWCIILKNMKLKALCAKYLVRKFHCSYSHEYRWNITNRLWQVLRGKFQSFSAESVSIHSFHSSWLNAIIFVGSLVHFLFFMVQSVQSYFCSIFGGLLTILHGLLPFFDGFLMVQSYCS